MTYSFSFSLARAIALLLGNEYIPFETETYISASQSIADICKQARLLDVLKSMGMVCPQSLAREREAGSNVCVDPLPVLSGPTTLCTICPLQWWSPLDRLPTYLRYVLQDLGRVAFTEGWVSLFCVEVCIFHAWYSVFF